MKTTLLRFASSSVLAINLLQDADADDPTGCRWMFGAKYIPGVTDMSKVVDSAKDLISSCPQYETAGYGVSTPGMSSYFDITLFVDSEDCNATAIQAGCMVETLNNDTNLAESLTSTIFDAAEISVKVSKKGNYKIATGDIMQSYFVRFKDPAQREWLSQRSSAFLNMAPFVGDFDLTDTQSSATQFPDSFLSKWPNDVHFAAMVNFGGTEEAYKNVAGFAMYSMSNPSNIGNNFVPGSSEIAYERHSMSFQAQMLE